jgi:hypothetical protein
LNSGDRERRDAALAKRVKLPRIKPAPRLVGSPLSRTDVTRGEYNRIIDVLNERAVILNEFRDAIHDLKQASDIQLKRIAQLQAEVDRMRRRLGLDSE